MAVPQLSFLRSRICCKGLGSNGSNGLNEKHSLEEYFGTLLLQLQQSHPLELARLGWLPRKAKLPLHGGWYRTGTVCHWPWNVKSTIRKVDLPQHKPGSPWKNWCNIASSLFCNAQWQALKTILNHGSWRLSHSFWFLRICLCCRDLSSNGLNNKHSLEEQLSHLARTTSTLWAKPVWLRRKAKLPLHGGRRPTGRICVWPNVKSAMRKTWSSPTQTWIACKNCWLPTTSQLHFFAHNLHLKSFYTLLLAQSGLL